MNARFWNGKRVLLTGHTGFKGGWLSLWLQKLGASVTGYALPPAGRESLYELALVGEHMQSVFGDIRNRERLQEVVNRHRPEIVFHLAAQPLVRQSYLDPVETYSVNVMGTVNLLDALRREASCRVLVNVTSDKCYENKEWLWGYRECDQLGGHDPYSSSKACAELVTAAFRRSYFEEGSDRTVAVGSARAGNVIGGGDFSKERIVPDFLAAARANTSLFVRNPGAVRPWQHVMDPLSGYLLLAERLWESPAHYSQSWNFGPTSDDIRSVQWVVEKLNEHCERRVVWHLDTGPKPHEATLLVLDSTKARMTLGWQPRWTLERAVQRLVEWHHALWAGESMHEYTLRQISDYEERPCSDKAQMTTSAPLPSQSATQARPKDFMPPTAGRGFIDGSQNA